jgi:predicted dehydrogenase
MSIGVAFIGGGMVSELHQLALSSVPGMDLVGLHDINADVRQKRAAEWGIKPYASLGKLLDDDAVDVVYILTPAETHVSLAMKCIESGRHVFVEKPVSNKPEAIDQLVEVSERCGCVVMPGHNYVYVPEFQRMARLVREGKLGTVRAMWINYAIKHPEFVAAAYGGVLEEVMIHHTYMTLALFGKPERVYAGIYVGAWNITPKKTSLDGGNIRRDDGASVFDLRRRRQQRRSLDICGQGARHRGQRLDDLAELDLQPGVGDAAFAVPIYEESYEGEARNLREAIERGVPVLSTLRDAAASARIITAAYEAADKHHRSQMDGEKRRW